MTAPSHYYIQLCNILESLCTSQLDDWPTFLSLSLFLFPMACISNCCVYYLYMLSRSYYLCTVTVLYCTASSTLVSCLIYLLCHSFLCDVLNLTCFVCNCQVTNAVCVHACTRARPQIASHTGNMRFKQQNECLCVTPKSVLTLLRN